MEKIALIKYIGSKRALLTNITGVIDQLVSPGGLVVDLFSGTSRVGHALKGMGHRVWSNDQNAYAHTLATCYVQADREKWEGPARKIMAELSALPGKPGYFTDTFCEQSRYFQPKNGARVDAMREHLENLDLDPELKAVLLVSLMEAADRVDSTAGVQMAYLKQWAPRAHNDIELRFPAVQPKVTSGKCKATQGDAEVVSAQIDADVVYLDPPYNQHSYLGNYHIWESLVLWDKPPVYGIACKREDCRTRKSAFNGKRAIFSAMETVLNNLKAKALVVSFNNEAYISRDQMESLLKGRGNLRVIEMAHDRYVGAKIGIYNPSGKKVGKIGHLKNSEYLYVLTQDDVHFSGPRTQTDVSPQLTLI